MLKGIEIIKDRLQRKRKQYIHQGEKIEQMFASKKGRLLPETPGFLTKKYEKNTCFLCQQALYLKAQWSKVE